MAKRRRLTPAKSEYLEPAPETKAMFPLGVAQTRRAAPIADVAREGSAVAALNELTETWQAARKEGRLVIALPHDEVFLDHLHRDRITVDPEDMEALKHSLRDRGQQTPIEVVPLPDQAGYGLLSGWRRCQALRALHEETGEARFATVQALVRHPEDAGAAYQTMVEENEIRANISHYERARIVVKAAEAGVFKTEKEALTQLYGAIPRARRSKIRSFLSIVHALDDALHFPEALTERTGLALAQGLRDSPGLADRIRGLLQKIDQPTVQSEQAAVAAALSAPRQKADKAAEDASVAALSGIDVLRRKDGAVILSGPALTEDLQGALVDWLRQQLKT
ncbi:MAG: ParB N-terminal domain-containing protein [Pseudomonadota bacterium]